jgi:hypothetical protein
MATSGISTHGRNRDQLLTRALRLCGAIASGETPGAQEITDAAEALNAMVKHWQATGVHIWRTTEATLFLQADQVRYELGATSTDHATETATQTTLSASAADGASSIVVTSATGIANGYYIGIQVDDGTFHWTTVNGAPAGTTVTLTSALDDSATSGAVVLVYQTKLVRPLKILSARVYNLTSAIETPVDEMDRIEYQELPNKTSTGSVNGFYYDRRGGANSTGYFYIWQPSNAVEDAIRMTVARPIQDFTAAGDDADLPQEWIEAIVWNLAERLAVEYDAPDSKLVRIRERAAQYLAEVNWWERELTEIELVVAR